MTRFSGVLAFSISEETRPGIWEKVITRYPVRGQMRNITVNRTEVEKINQDSNLKNYFRIVSNPWLVKNMYNVEYFEFMGHRWVVTSIEIKQNVLMIYTGGKYNDRYNNDEV